MPAYWEKNRRFRTDMKTTKTSRLFLTASVLSLGVASVAGNITTVSVFAEEVETDSFENKATEELKAEFFDALMEGLNRRWDYIDGVDESGMSAEERREYGEAYVSMEYESVEDYSDLFTGDEDFDETVAQYFKGIELQRKAYDEFDDTYKYMVDFQAGSYNRAKALVRLAEKYGLEIDDENLLSYKETVAMNENGNPSYDENGRAVKQGIPTLNAIEIEDYELDPETSYDYGFVKWRLSVRNLMDFPLEDFRLDVKILDSDGDVVGNESSIGEEDGMPTRTTRIEAGETADLWIETNCNDADSFKVVGYRFSSNGESHESYY